MTLVPATLAAHSADVRPGTLRQWARRGHISPPTGGLYDLDEITTWIDQHRNTARSRALRLRHARTPVVADPQLVV
jgi:hypothetical protein